MAKWWTREVDTVAAFDAEVMADLDAASATCVAEAAWQIKEILPHENPGLEDRCGLLGDTFELYAMGLPGCGDRVMGVSLTLSEPEPWPCRILGLVPAGAHACETVRRRAMRHFRLVDPVWEPVR